MNEQFETQNPVENTDATLNAVETFAPQPPKKKNKKIAIIAGTVAAVVAIGGIGAFAVVKTGAFLSPSKKVLLAGAKTVSDTGSFGEAIKDCASLYSEEYTLKMDMSTENGDFSIEGRNSKDEKQIKGNLNISGAPAIDFLADMNAELVQIEVPTISDQLFTYDYRNEKTGYLLEMVDKNMLDAMDAALRDSFDAQKSDEVRAELKKIFVDEYNSLEFTKTETKDFVINGEQHSCKGYETVVTKENMNHVIDGVENLYGESYAELLETLDVTAADYVAGLREKVEEMPDSTTVVFYLYKGQYAAIDVTPGAESTTEIQFLGGDTRMQNMKLLTDGQEVFNLEGDQEGTVQTITFSEENGTAVFTYDSSSGDITYDVTGMDSTYSYQFAGNLAIDKNSAVLTIDDLGTDSEDMSGTVTWEKGAQFDEVSGEVFDLGNATEEEWRSLLGEIFGALLGGF